MLNPVRWLCPTHTSVLSHRNLSEEEGKREDEVVFLLACWMLGAGLLLGFNGLMFMFML
jgi:hypothetical protein